MLCHTLYENGILDISELEGYVHDDIERNINRLDDVKRRLQASYQDMLTVTCSTSCCQHTILTPCFFFVGSC